MVKRGKKPAVSRAAQKHQQAESQPLTKVPAPPKYFGEHARAYWQQLAPQLIEAKILTQLHLESFVILCEMYQEYRVWNDWLREDPSRCTFKTLNQSECESPQVRMRDKALANLQKLWPKFGMTPFSLAQMRKHGGIAAAKAPAIVDFAAAKYDDEANEDE